MKKSSRGFTLIELLVVIAIIGILSSVVLASLTSARTKGQDAAIQNELANMRAQAELFYTENNNNYGVSNNSCSAGMFSDISTTTSDLSTLVVDVESKNGAASVTCDSDGAAWVVGTTLPGSGQIWCVDSTGKSASSTPDTANSKCI